MDQAQVLETLKRGMSTELWGLRFYQEAAERTQAADGQRVFRSLVAEENGHLDILRGQYAAVAGGAEWVSMEQARAMGASAEPLNIFPEAAQAERLIPEDTTDAQALEMAMRFERRGFDLYTQEAARATNRGEKAMWEYLAKAEDRHYAFLDETYQYLRTHGVWYYDEREKPFFEG